MDRQRRLPQDMPPELEGQLFDLFAQHFGVPLRRMTDPATGKAYIDMAQVCEILGLDVEEERARLLADPTMGDALVIYEPPPVVPADLQAHQIGICNPATCHFCRT